MLPMTSRDVGRMNPRKGIRYMAKKKRKNETKAMSESSPKSISDTFLSKLTETARKNNQIRKQLPLFFSGESVPQDLLADPGKEAERLQACDQQANLYFAIREARAAEKTAEAELMRQNVIYHLGMDVVEQLDKVREQYPPTHEYSLSFWRKFVGHPPYAVDVQAVSACLVEYWHLQELRAAAGLPT